MGRHYLIDHGAHPGVVGHIEVIGGGAFGRPARGRRDVVHILDRTGIRHDIGQADGLAGRDRLRECTSLPLTSTSVTAADACLSLTTTLNALDAGTESPPRRGPVRRCVR